MNRRNILIQIGTLLLSIALAYAGEVRLWTPQELFERSQVVVIGRPTHIENTGKKGSLRFNERLPLIPTDIYAAKVQIVEVIKGDDLMELGRLKVKEITITFSRVAETKVIDTQYVHRISLQKGGLFLFYLNPIKDGTYLNALDGEVNDYQAAKSLISKSTGQESEMATPRKPSD